MDAEYDLPPGWVKPLDGVKLKLAKGLQRELSPGHTLHDKKTEVVAQRVDCDDVLVWSQDNKNFYVVHLTWSNKAEPLPQPTTRAIGDFSEFATWSQQHYYDPN